MTDKDRSNIDSVLTYILIKKLITPIIKTKAYKLGLVDKVGHSLKKPETSEEKTALSVFDKFIFKLKRLLGGKVMNLHRFLYLQTLNNDFYSKLLVKGSVENRAEIKRIKKGVEGLAEKYDRTFEEILMGILNEELRQEDINEI